MNREGKQKGFLMSYSWVWAMLLGLGGVFLLVALIIQFVPIDPNSITVTVNGVRQPPTEATVRTFRLIFLLVFGVLGLMAAGTGGVFAGRAARRRKLARRLREEGVCVSAQVVEITGSNVRVNNRYLPRLRCTYRHHDGTQYVFQSGALRMDPLPYLPDGRVRVYHDRDDMRRYFVDVDGSVAGRVVEL